MDDGDDDVAVGGGGPGGGADDLWEPVPPPAHNDDDEHEDDDDHPQVIEEVARNDDGTLDGGEAVESSKTGGRRKRSSQCDLILFVECIESIYEAAPNHPILKPGVTVSIGLDKNTKLSAVFGRYVEFCNETTKSSNTKKTQMTDLEFVHCTLLNGSDTAEASALMKNDRIKVRKVRTSQRELEAEQSRVQRESDREYFRQLRMLLPDMIGTKNCDILLDCRGKLVDENGLNQEVLRTGVRGHSSILAKRCKWLGRIIQCARDELERRSVVTIPDNDGNSAGAAGESGQESPTGSNNGRDVLSGESPQENDETARRAAAAAGEEDDDDGFGVVGYLNQQNDSRRVVGNDRNGGAAEIEIDDDDDSHRYQQALEEAEELENSRSGSPVISSTSGSNSLLWVTLPNHPPEAVKLLLEYCYTNRVIPLGQDAFTEASRTRQEQHGKRDMVGPVPPFPSHSQGVRRWPNNGLPTVSFSVALAGIALAEEASMPRLSLMCEVAASQLVAQSNLVEALTACTTQQQRTGNALPRLRQATMDIVLRRGQRGVVDLYRTPTFRRALEEKSAVVVPSLLVGTMEAVQPKKPNHTVDGCKQELLTGTTRKYFDMLDREDVYFRETERRKRRIERWKENGTDGMVIGDDDAMMMEDDGMMMMDPLAAMWASEPSKMSLKRMSHHLGSNFSMGRSDGSSRSKRLNYALLGRRGPSSRANNSNSTNRRRGGRGKGV